MVWFVCFLIFVVLLITKYVVDDCIRKRQQAEALAGAQTEAPAGVHGMAARGQPHRPTKSRRRVPSIGEIIYLAAALLATMFGFTVYALGVSFRAVLTLGVLCVLGSLLIDSIVNAAKPAQRSSLRAKAQNLIGAPLLLATLVVAAWCVVQGGVHLVRGVVQAIQRLPSASEEQAAEEAEKRPKVVPYVLNQWNAVPGATYYRVQRGSTSGGPYTFVGTSTANNYVDVGVEPGVTYYYVIEAWNGDGHRISRFADERPITIVPVAPGDTGGSAAAVRVRGGNGRLISLQDRLAEEQAEENARAHPPTVEAASEPLACDTTGDDLKPADYLAAYGREWTQAQVAPVVADFGWGGFDCRSDSSGLHESMRFTEFNGSVRRVTYCFLSADRKTRRCAIWND
jgi:hypothetical protein